MEGVQVSSSYERLSGFELSSLEDCGMKREARSDIERSAKPRLSSSRCLVKGRSAER